LEPSKTKDFYKSSPRHESDKKEIKKLKDDKKEKFRL
jgi:hypothetical protein